MLPEILLPFLLVLTPQTGDGWLGVYLRETDHPEIAEVIPGSPAAAAGLQAGDRFLAVGDILTKTREAFALAIRGVTPGTEVALRIRRGDREIVKKARLGERPADAGLPVEVIEEPKTVEERPPRPDQEPAPARRAFLGLSLREEPEGVIVRELVEDGPSAAAGIRVGERIVRFGEIDIVTFRDLERALSRMAPGDKIDLTLRSDRGTRSVLVELGAAPGSPPPRPERADPQPPDRQPRPTDRPARDAQPRQAGPVELLDDLAAARRVAEAQGKPILLVFGASWNSASRAQRKAMADPAVAERLEGTVPVWLDTDEHGDEAQRFAVQELPDLRILEGDNTVWRHEGYLPPAELAGVLAKHVGEDKGATGDVPDVDREVRAALERVAKRLDRVEERLRRIEAAARELEGLAELRQELEAIRKLLRELSGGR